MGKELLDFLDEKKRMDAVLSGMSCTQDIYIELPDIPTPMNQKEPVALSILCEGSPETEGTRSIFAAILDSIRFFPGVH